MGHTKLNVSTKFPDPNAGDTDRKLRRISSNQCAPKCHLIVDEQISPLHINIFLAQNGGFSLTGWFLNSNSRPVFPKRITRTEKFVSSVIQPTSKPMKNAAFLQNLAQKYRLRPSNHIGSQCRRHHHRRAPPSQLDRAAEALPSPAAISAADSLRPNAAASAVGWPANSWALHASPAPAGRPAG